MKWILYLEAFKSEQKIQIDSAAVVMEALIYRAANESLAKFLQSRKRPLI